MAEVEGSARARRGQIDVGAVATDGVLGGLLAAAVVAVVFFIHDVIKGVPLHTPSVLGANLFWGAEAARSMKADTGVALAFNAVHVSSLVVGASLISFMAALGERSPKLWYLPFVALGVLLAAVLYVDGALGVPGLARFRLTAAALLGAGTVVAFLVWRRPRIAARIYDAWRE
jgi:hypothetical protein